MMRAAVMLCMCLVGAEGKTPGGESASSCVTCHLQMEGSLQAPVTEWKDSIHSQIGVGCTDCHGGNPKSDDNAMDPAAGFRGKVKPRAVPALCASCHADVKKMRPYNIRTDQYEEYKTSVHGQRLLNNGDENVATCASCHGAHGIRKKDDPLSRVYHTQVPEMCGKCHSNGDLMKPYGIPTDQLAKYRESYHGQVLFGKIPGKNPTLAPNCASCHGIHGATPPGVKEIPNVCGNCHGNTADNFREGPHFKAMVQYGKPRCIDCHGHHDNRFPDYTMFEGNEERHCGSCHPEGSPQSLFAQHMGKAFLSYDASLSGLDGELREVEKWGRNVEDLYMALNQAKTALTEAGPLAHSLNMTKVTEKLSEGEKSLSKLKEGVAEIRKEVKGRKIVMFGADGLILVIIALLLLTLKVKS